MYTDTYSLRVNKTDPHILIDINNTEHPVQATVYINQLFPSTYNCSRAGKLMYGDTTLPYYSISSCYSERIIISTIELKSFSIPF